MKEKIKIIIPTLLIIVSIGILAYFWISPRDNFKCPNDYATFNEYANATAKWIRAEMDKNPDISEENLLGMRTKELETHKCEKSRWL